jgi:hypothetical protein
LVVAGERSGIAMNAAPHGDVLVRSWLGFHVEILQNDVRIRVALRSNFYPRQQMLDDLSELITTYNSQNNKTILMMDANENLFTTNSKLPMFLAQTNMISLIQPHNHPATHSRGSHCIDYIFGTSSILEHVTQAGITSFYEQTWPLTDHRGLFVDIHYLGLFGASTHSLMPRTPKRITSLSKNMIHKFITKIEQTAQIHNLLQKLNELDSNQNWTDNEHKLLENIDVKFTTILLEAEAAIAIPVQYPWSPELHQSSLIYTYWIIHLKENKTKLDVTKQLNDIQKQLTTHDVYQNNILRRPLMQLRTARKNLINCRLEAHQHRDNYLRIQHETLVESGK